jgi:hypothetical protein
VGRPAGGGPWGEGVRWRGRGGVWPRGRWP